MKGEKHIKRIEKPKDVSHFLRILISAQARATVFRKTRR